MQSSPKFSNRLISETSPYLLQHAHNPVDWYPWGPEALERKRNAHPRIPIWIHWLCRGRDDRNQPLQQSASNAAVSNAQQEIGPDVRGRSGMQHPALDIVQLQPTRTVNQHVSVA